MRRWAEQAAAPPEAVWPLLARPALWSRWAPHLGGAWGLGRPEVEEGRTGFARLGGIVPVPARVGEVVPGRSWTWLVPPLTLRHEVLPASAGRSEIAIELSAPGPVEPAAAATYGRAIPPLLRRLAQAAERAA